MTIDTAEKTHTTTGSNLSSFPAVAANFHDTNTKGSTEILQPSQIQHILHQYEAFILDCDGVLWAGGHTLPRVVETIALLRSLGKKLVFVTNNSTRSRKECRDKFMQFGVVIDEEDLWPTTHAVSSYISSEHPEVKRAFVIGGEGLKEEVREAGVEVVGRNDVPQVTSEHDFAMLDVLQPDSRVEAVIAGFDFGVDYSAISYASLCLQHIPGCLFIATSRDSFDQLSDRRIPGMTMTVAGIEASSGRTPLIAGKPSPWLIQHIIKHYSLDPKRTLMIGDRLDTDILFGKNGGTDTMLVLTGCTKREEVSQLPPDDIHLPTYIMPSFGILSSVPLATTE